MIITQFDQQQFMQEYWQKKPCIIRQFVPDFVDPIDENDLAGLAQEEQVDSRIVSYQKDGVPKDAWQVAQGPFDDFAEHCQGDWSLLVQGVDKYVDEVNALTHLLDFIPYWRLDDVMVSFSNSNAGVGPHIDEYDVFIVQGKGTRRWQVGLPSDFKTVLKHSLLKQIDGFEPTIDEVLQPGDAVYIPPKHPHNGVALEDCLNYSIGFRAPTNLELINGLLDDSEELLAPQARYTDPDISNLRQGSQAPQVVSNAELEKLKSSLVSLLDTPEATQCMLKYLSLQQLPSFTQSNDEGQSEDSFTLEELKDMLSEGLTIAKMPAVRPIYADIAEHSFTFYIDGTRFNVQSNLSALVKELLAQEQVDVSDAMQKLEQAPLNLAPAYFALILQLLNFGYWELVD